MQDRLYPLAFTFDRVPLDFCDFTAFWVQISNSPGIFIFGQAAKLLQVVLSSTLCEFAVMAEFADSGPFINIPLELLKEPSKLIQRRNEERT